MSNDVTLNRQLLEFLTTTSPSYCKVILQHADKSLIRSISEISFNCLYSDLNLPSEAKQKLKKFKSNLRKLATKSTTVAEKRALLSARGQKFLRALLKPTLLLIDSLPRNAGPSHVRGSGKLDKHNEVHGRIAHHERNIGHVPTENSGH